MEQNELLIYINGKFWEKSKATVSVFDHGLLYGDGIFETLRAYEGKILLLSKHLDRLFISARSIFLKIDHSPSELKSVLYQTLEKNHLKGAYLRLSITRGEGPIGLNPALCPKPTIIVITNAFNGHPESLYQSGIKACITHIRRNAPLTTDPSIKSLNFLNNISAMHQAIQAGCQEAVMLNLEGMVSEGSISNIFWVKDKILKTPALACGLLSGVTREIVINIARSLGITVEEGCFTPKELSAAQEIFVTNTGYEIMPVTMLDQHLVADGKPGQITTCLHQEYQKKIPELLEEN